MLTYNREELYEICLRGKRWEKKKRAEREKYLKSSINEDNVLFSTRKRREGEVVVVCVWVCVLVEK